MSNFLSGLFPAINSAATTLLSLAAGAESSIHTWESTNPLVADAISFAEQEIGAFPIVGQGEALGKAVLAFAQVLATMTSTQATAATAAKTSTTTSNTPSTKGTQVTT